MEFNIQPFHICHTCNSAVTYIHPRDIRPMWYRNPLKSGTYLCGKCRSQLYYRQNRKKIRSHQNNKRAENLERYREYGRWYYHNKIKKSISNKIGSKLHYNRYYKKRLK